IEATARVWRAYTPHIAQGPGAAIKRVQHQPSPIKLVGRGPLASKGNAEGWTLVERQLAQVTGRKAIAKAGLGGLLVRDRPKRPQAWDHQEQHEHHRKGVEHYRGAALQAQPGALAAGEVKGAPAGDNQGDTKDAIKRGLGRLAEEQLGRGSDEP